jgi:hypothetical protein
MNESEIPSPSSLFVSHYCLSHVYLSDDVAFSAAEKSPHAGGGCRLKSADKASAGRKSSSPSKLVESLRGGSTDKRKRETFESRDIVLRAY